MERKVLDISWEGLWRIFFFVGLVAIMFSGRHILLGLFFAIVISSGLERVVDFLENRGLPRTLGVVLIFLCAILFFIVVVYTVIPFIIASLNTIFTNLSRTGPDAWWAPLVRPSTTQSLAAFINRLSSQFLSGNGTAIGTISDAIGGIGLAIAIAVSSFYLSISRDGVERFIRIVFPADYEAMALRVYERSRRKIGSWFRMQVILSIIMGVLTWLTLLLLGVKHALLLGLLAGLFEVAPFVGPILSGAAATLVAMTTSPILGFYTLIAFLALHQLESHVLVPILTNRTVGLHPVIVIIALLMGAQIGGFLGLLIGVPAAAVFQEIIEDWSGRKRPRETTS